MCLVRIVVAGGGCGSAPPPAPQRSPVCPRPPGTLLLGPCRGPAGGHCLCCPPLASLPPVHPRAGPCFLHERTVFPGQGHPRTPLSALPQHPAAPSPPGPPSPGGSWLCGGAKRGCMRLPPPPPCPTPCQQSSKPSHAQIGARLAVHAEVAAHAGGLLPASQPAWQEGCQGGLAGGGPGRPPALPAPCGGCVEVG